MIREDLSNVNVLRSVDEETPPEDVKEDEENSSAETGNVIRVEILGSESAEEDDAGGAANATNEQEEATAEAVNVECCPDVAEDGEGGPAGV